MARTPVRLAPPRHQHEPNAPVLVRTAKSFTSFGWKSNDSMVLSSDAIGLPCKVLNGGSPALLTCTLMRDNRDKHNRRVGSKMVKQLSAGWARTTAF